MAIYHVSLVDPDLERKPGRLVRAMNAAQALRHVASDFEVTVATPDELIDLTKAGVEVEVARDAAVLNVTPTTSQPMTISQPKAST